MQINIWNDGLAYFSIFYSSTVQSTKEGLRWQFVFDCILETEISLRPDKFHIILTKVIQSSVILHRVTAIGRYRAQYDICGKVNTDIIGLNHLKLIVKNHIESFFTSGSDCKTGTATIKAHVHPSKTPVTGYQSQTCFRAAPPPKKNICDWAIKVHSWLCSSGAFNHVSGDEEDHEMRLKAHSVWD